MNYKEYLELSEFVECEFDEGFLSTLGGMIDSGISGVGTTSKQAIRGVGNVGVGGVRTMKNTLGSVFGSEDSRKKAKSNLGSSISQMGKGVIQTAAAPISGLYRGIETARNPFSTMKQDSGSGWGHMFGVRSKANDSANVPSWQQLVSQYRSSKSKNEKIKVAELMKRFHKDKYEAAKAKAKSASQKTQRYQPMRVVRQQPQQQPQQQQPQQQQMR